MAFFNIFILKTTNIGTFLIYASKLMQVILGLFLVIYVPKCLTNSEQGYYFTIINLASLTIMFEFGLASVLTTASAHNFVGLAWSSEGQVVGDGSNNFIGLARYGVKWYLRAFILSLLVICPLGGLFISSSSLNNSVEWLGPWIMSITASSSALLATPLLVVVEGSGEVTEAYMVRLMQTLVGGSGALLALFFGAGLYAAAMTALGTAIVGGFWCLTRKRAFVIQILREIDSKIQLKTDLLSIQWRAALSWLAGYALVLMYVPLLFRTQGAEAAGKMAISMNVVNMTVVLAASWLIGRLPLIAAYIAEKKWEQADLLFRSTFFKSLALYFFGAFLILTIRVLLFNTKYDGRVLPFMELLVLIAGMGFYHASGLLASYLRSYLKEPMVKISIIVIIVTVVGAFKIAPVWGSYGIVWLIFLVNMLLLFPATVYLFFKLRKEWQSA